MATHPPLTEQLIQDSMVRAVQNVSRTMIRCEACLVTAGIDPASPDFSAGAHIFGSVGFVGELNGLVYLCIPDDFATNAASRMLGLSAAEVTMDEGEVLRDVIGEITNMTVGGFKNALCDLGFPCKLTLPTIVRGHNLNVAAIKEATRHIVRFDCEGHRLVADIQIKAA